ncbi:MAG TPA: hypothetical protein VHZ50_18370, partial [Puia sp.]|nr:hypothetical protein [Puia sp.]
MKWKIFLIVLINLFFIFFPGNIIGCGGEIDPYDYYTSFFQNDLSTSKNFDPFYYTNSLFLYDDKEPVDVSHATSGEWIEYCGNKATENETYDFVCHFSYEDLKKVYEKIEKNADVHLDDSLTKNNITKYFLQHKDLEALGYLMYAKKVEPSVTGTWNEWGDLKHDSLKMDRLIKDGKQLYAASKNEFVKLRFAYQITRLALYSNNAKDCIRYYDEMIKENKTKSILLDLSVSLKAGALFRIGNKYRAALLFSKLFSKTSVKRVANYLSFDWCVKRLKDSDRVICLHLCKTDIEKANLLGLFALGSNVREEKTLKKIYSYDPNSEMLEVLAAREINKIEENYLTAE